MPLFLLIPDTLFSLANRFRRSSAHPSPGLLHRSLGIQAKGGSSAAQHRALRGHRNGWLIFEALHEALRITRALEEATEKTTLDATASAAPSSDDALPPTSIGIFLNGGASRGWSPGVPVAERRRALRHVPEAPTRVPRSRAVPIGSPACALLPAPGCTVRR